MNDSNLITIGKSETGPVVLDVNRLIKTRLLVTANSGGGKSWLLRLLFEQLGKTTPLIVLDREGEFVTLREKLDVVLVGPQGEVPTDVRSAGLLVRRLMERSLSAVIDMSELSIGHQRQYVRRFLEELIGLPKSLWRPTFFGLDETHLFAPERGSGEAESTEAVVNLSTLGRKRGYCPIYATQRISKFHKDAAADILNKFIGRTTLDVDQDRAADELGMNRKESRAVLREMSPIGSEGEFFGFGPAMIQPGVTRFRVGKVSTTHPEAGQGRTIQPPKPSRAITAVLSELQDLPKQAEAEIKDMAAAKQRIATLERELAAVAKRTPAPAARVEPKRVEVPVLKDGQLARLDGFTSKLAELIEKAGGMVASLREAGEPVAAAVRSTRVTTAPIAPTRVTARPVVTQPRPVASTPTTSDGSPLPEGERKVLTAAAQYPDGATRDQITILTGYKRSTRDAYLQRARTRGFITGEGDRIVATVEGVAALGDSFEHLPTGDALRTYWIDRLPEGERKILQVLIEHYPAAVDRERIGEATGFKRSTRDAYLQRLATRRLVTSTERGTMTASGTLFGV